MITSDMASNKSEMCQVRTPDTASEYYVSNCDTEPNDLCFLGSIQFQIAFLADFRVLGKHGTEISGRTAGGLPLKGRLFITFVIV